MTRSVCIRTLYSIMKNYQDAYQLDILSHEYNHQ